MQNEARAPAHEWLDADIWCCRSQLVIVVAIARCDMITWCSLFIVSFMRYWYETKRGGLLTTYVAVTPTLLSPSLLHDARCRQNLSSSLPLSKWGRCRLIVIVSSWLLFVIMMTHNIWNTRAHAHEWPAVDIVVVSALLSLSFWATQYATATMHLVQLP